MKQQPVSKIILVDLDGPLADLEGEFLKRWKRLHPGEFFVPFDERKNFFLRDDYPAPFKTEVDAILRTDGFFADLPPVGGAREALGGMEAAGHEIIICTSDIFANPTGLADKRQWVRRHLGDERAQDMVFTRDKTLIRGDVLVDDRPAITGALEPAWEHVIFDQPFNRSVSGKPRMNADWSNWQKLFA